jgi:hypothetical protein
MPQNPQNYIEPIRVREWISCGIGQCRKFKWKNVPLVDDKEIKDSNAFCNNLFSSFTCRAERLKLWMFLLLQPIHP